VDLTAAAINKVMPFVSILTPYYRVEQATSARWHVKVIQGFSDHIHREIGSNRYRLRGSLPMTLLVSDFYIMTSWPHRAAARFFLHSACLWTVVLTSNPLSK